MIFSVMQKYSKFFPQTELFVNGNYEENTWFFFSISKLMVR